MVIPSSSCNKCTATTKKVTCKISERHRKWVSWTVRRLLRYYRNIQHKKLYGSPIINSSELEQTPYQFKNPQLQNHKRLQVQSSSMTNNPAHHQTWGGRRNLATKKTPQDRGSATRKTWCDSSPARVSGGNAHRPGGPARSK